MSFGIAKQSYLCLYHGKDSHDDLMLWAVRHVRTKSRLTSCDMGRTKCLLRVENEAKTAVGKLLQFKLHFLFTLKLQFENVLTLGDHLWKPREANFFKVHGIKTTVVCFDANKILETKGSS